MEGPKCEGSMKRDKSEVVAYTVSNNASVA